jgi:hypothetical protein
LTFFEKAGNCVNQRMEGDPILTCPVVWWGMAIPLKTWQAARNDYIGGGGSLRLVAERHGLKLATVEKRAKRESWYRLRRDRDEALRTGAAPPSFPPAYAPPESTSEPLSESWLEEKRRTHFLETQRLIEDTRAKLRKMLEGDGLDCDKLVRLASALNTLAETETRVLGIRDTRKDKPRRRAYSTMPDPIPTLILELDAPEPVAAPQPVPV